MKLQVISEPKDIQSLQHYLMDKDFIAYDCETTGLTARHEVIGISVCAEEDLAYYVILAKWNPKKQCLEYNNNKTETTALIQSLVGKNLIMHNGIFDCMMAEAYFKTRLIPYLHTDTMIMAHLLDETRKVGLKELALEFFGEDATKEQEEMKASVLENGGIWLKKEKEMFKADPELLGKYGAKDAILTFKLFHTLLSDLADQNLVEFFYDEESMPLLRRSTYDLNTTGMIVDQDALNKLKNTLKAECEEAKAFIYKEIHKRIKNIYPGTKKSNTFNIGSPAQLSRLLFGIYELEFGVLTKEGKTVCRALGIERLPYTPAQKRAFISECTRRKDEIYQPSCIVNGKAKKAKKVKDPWGYLTCDKDVINKYKSKYEWINKLHLYQKNKKILGTYVEGIEERIQYGVIRPSYKQHGTKTGRYSSNNPNLQNLPRDDQRVKTCFIPRPGKVFVSADFSQLEPRTFAYYSQDKRLMSAFDGNSDFYSVVGIEVYDKNDSIPQKEGSDNAFGVKYKTLRNNTKAFALAAAYGGLESRIAKITGRSIDDTRDDMEKYFERFPGVQKMMLEAHELVKKQGFVTNLFGRKRHIPEAKRINKLYGPISHSKLPYEVRKLLNTACNFRIQSTGASIVNRSAIAFYNLVDNANIDCKLVSQIHDELVVECSETDAEEVSALLQYAMETTVVLPGVPLEAIPRITKSLAK